MDLDAMAIHVRKLKEFRDKWEPFLEELAKQKAEYEAHPDVPELESVDTATPQKKRRNRDQEQMGG